MRRNEIHIRDPYIFPYEGKYYLYGTGIPGSEDLDIGRQFWCYVSEDLEEWSEPILCFDAPNDFWGEKNFWAPEVHKYNGKFYMLASFFAKDKMRATQALVADRPEGPFRVFGKALTPEDWMCLDGTLHIEKGVPYLVFCHEWVQVGDGEIAVVPLKEDLSEASGDTTVLFKASESGWSQLIEKNDRRGFVTDGPYLVESDGELTMFWSSFRENNYAVGMSVSKSGSIFGPWEHLEQLLFDKDGGHGMYFEGLNGKKYFALHQPNAKLSERPFFIEIQKKKEKSGYKLI